MVYIIESVLFIKKSVSQVGTNGILYNKVMQALHTNLHTNNSLGDYNLEMFRKLGIYIAKNYLSNDGYLFKFENGEAFINIIDFNEDLFHMYESLICFAPLPNIWKELGIENISDMPIVDSPVHDLLQRTVASEYNGFIVSEENIPNGHHNMDKLVYTGLLVKRLIQIKNLSKSTIIHSKYFAKSFDPSKHGYKLVVHKTYIERIIKRILFILDIGNLNTMSVKDLASILGLNSNDMQYIRNAVTSLNKTTSFCGIRFYQIQNLYCVSKVALDDNIGECVLDFQCQRNLPIYETIAFAIENKNGITSNQLRKIISCNNTKKLHKIFFELNKKLHYPFEKIQDGKHLQFKLISKPVETNTFNVQTLNDSIQKDISDNVTSSSMASQKGCVVSPSCRTQSDQSILLLSSSNRVQKSEVNQSHLLTDEQKLHAKIICDHLSKDSTVGLYTLSDLVIEVRSFYRKQSQQKGANKIDKQTINRLLSRLELDQRIECIEIVDPRDNYSNNQDYSNINSKTLIKLYKIKDHKPVNESISNYISIITANNTSTQKRKRENDNKVTNELCKSRKLNKSISNRIDDMFLFDKFTIGCSDNLPQHTNTTLCSTGICLRSISLHNHLLQILKISNDTTVVTIPLSVDDDPKVQRFSLDSLLLELPLYFFMTFSHMFALAEFEREYVQLFIKCLNEGLLVNDWLEIESSLGSLNHFHLFLNNVTTKLEFVRHVCFLVSLGILQVIDLNTLTIHLMHYLKNNKLQKSIDLYNLLITDKICNDEAANQHHQMELFTKFFEYLNGLNCNRTLSSLEKVTNSLDIYNHWKLIVLPSIPFDWDSLVITNRLSTIGVYTLIHNIKTSRCNDIDLKQIEQDINLRGLRVLKSSMLHHWGCRHIADAWRDVNLLHWKSLLCAEQHFDNNHQENYTCTTIITGIYGNNSSSSNNNSNDNSSNQTISKSTANINFSTKTIDQMEIDLRPYYHDEQLEQEINVCFSSLDDEFSTRQIAILLEAFLLSFINKQSSSVLPVPLQLKAELIHTNAMDVVINLPSGAYLDVVNPLVSCLDIDWKDIDFTFVSDSAISLAVSSSKTPIYLNTAIKKRLIQFLRIKPKLTHLLAWIVCNKGSLPGTSFRNTTNLVLNPIKDRNTITDTNRIIPFVIEHCICSYSNRRNITDFLKKNYSSDIMKKVFRELFIRGYIKKRKTCDYPDCSNSCKSGYRCSHQKHYELTEAFHETNNILLSTFYRSLIKYKESNILKNILTGIVECALFKDNFPAQLASLYNCLSRNPNISMNEIDLVLNLNNEVVKVNSFNLEDEIIDGSNKKVLFSKENYLSRGSTFCQRQLNNIEIKAFIRIKNEIALNYINTSNETTYSNNSFINYSIFELFAGKVLAIIAENPGITIDNLHTHLNLLSKMQTFELTRIMEIQNLITSKKCTNSIFFKNPFDVKNIFSQQTKLKSKKLLHPTETCFFIQNNFN